MPSERKVLEARRRINSFAGIREWNVEGNGRRDEVVEQEEEEEEDEDDDDDEEDAIFCFKLSIVRLQRV
ncbi:hypothetical protein M0802_000326 [Mischocyttarus mexicanus]|nr:hypothetical protein M0802_000326 [Mischocyttarus mexicanus]